MNKVLIAAFAASVALSASPALAWKAKTVMCYDKVWVDPTYSYSKKLVSEGRYEYKYEKHGKVKKVYYAPVYEVESTKTADGYYQLQPVSCEKY